MQCKTCHSGEEEVDRNYNFTLSADYTSAI